MISGGSGAGGDAPKILLRMAQDTEQVWVDPYPDTDSPDDFFLVKFPRRGSQNSRPTSRDIDILVAESAYYCELAAMGVETIDVEKMRFLDDGFHEPTLWLPRFDRRFDSVTRRWSLLGMESINAAINDRHSTRHEAVLLKIKGLIARHADDFLMSIEELTAEWVVRDFLNIAFSNSDNHGRNTSFLKTEAGIRLAPVYDFAPMAADPESIHRTLRWDRSIEAGGEIRWHRLPRHLSDLGLGDEATLHDRLAWMMKQCQGLDERLRDRGVPDRILSHPRISMKDLTKRLDRWQLDLCGSTTPHSTAHDVNF